MADVINLGDLRAGDLAWGRFPSSLRLRGSHDGKTRDFEYQVVALTPGADPFRIDCLRPDAGRYYDYMISGIPRAAAFTETRVIRVDVRQHYSNYHDGWNSITLTGNMFVLEIRYRVLGSASPAPVDPPLPLPLPDPGDGGDEDPIAPEPPPSIPDAPLLTWFQAQAEAVGGSRIRVIDWSDRFLEFDGALWHLQLFNPLTGAAGTRRVVQATDFGAGEFRSLRWTLAEIPGQPATAGTFWQQVNPHLRFP